jgi:hypothetical protein
MRLKLELSLYDSDEIAGVEIADALRNFADGVEGMEFSDFEIYSMGKILKMENGKSIRVTVTE